MSSTARRPIHPHDTTEHRSVRKIHIQNLTTLLHVCLLKRDIPRASRAWAILIRCREVEWQSRWQWGLALLEASSPAEPVTAANSYAATQPGRGAVDRWLRSLQLSAKEADKPAVLHALVLHYIKAGRYRLALDELETYVTSYPYLLAGPLHTYAGMLSFFLAQPDSARHESGYGITIAPPAAPARSGSLSRRGSRSRSRRRGARQESEQSNATEYSSSSSIPAGGRREPPSENLLKRARAHFNKALEQDPSDDVAKEFIALIDRENRDDGSDDGLEPMLDEEDDEADADEDGSEPADKGEEKEEDKDDDRMDSDEENDEDGDDRRSDVSAETVIRERSI